MTLLALSVAVTGGIGAGKSTISAELAARGATIVDFDVLAREIVHPGSYGLTEVVREFGTKILDVDGALDRVELGRLVFGNQHALRRLEAITHPLVRELAAARLAAVPADQVVISDIPLIRSLPEAAHYHLVIGVGLADAELRLQRLIARGHPEVDAQARMRAQVSDDVRRTLSDVWIDNAGPSDGLGPALDALWHRLTVFAAHRRAASPADAGVWVDPPNLEDLSPIALTVARVQQACGGREPRVECVSEGGLSLTVELDDANAVDDIRSTLQEAGFPALVGHVDGGLRFGNADPGQDLDLHLTVRL